MNATRIIQIYLNSAMRLYAPVDVSDGQGGFIRTFNLIGTIPCRVVPKGAGERVIGAESGQQVGYTIFCNADAPIKRGQRGEAGELNLEIMGVREPSLMGHHLEVDARQWQDNAPGV